MSFFNLFKKTQENPHPHTKPDLQSTFFNMKVKQLPDNFAQSVMDLEMRLQFAQTYDIEAVQQLNQLYRRAIEYYVVEDPRKAKHFQRKLTSLLANPQTLSLFEQNKEKEKEKPKQLNYRNNLRSQMGQFNAQSNTLVTQIIEGSDRKMEKTGRIVNQQIIDQQSRLRSRLEHRSTSRQSRKKKEFLSP